MRHLTIPTVCIAVMTSAACSMVDERTGPTTTTTTEKAFAPGGSVDVQLEGGDYELKVADGDYVRVTLTGQLGNTHADIAVDGSRATVTVKDTPHSKFKAVIELPKNEDLKVNLSGGDLVVGAFLGNKDIQSGAGDVTIAAGSPDDYASANASLIAGDLSADIFNGTRSGLNPHFDWTGSGKYTLRARLGAGDLRITR